MDGTLFFPLLDPPAACPGCGSVRIRPLHVRPLRHNKRRVNRQLNLALIGCEDCGLASSHPLPTDDEIAAYYGTADGWQERIPADEAEVTNGLERRRTVHRGHLELVLRHAGSEPGGRALRAFDFGCGMGGWLDALQEAGWETVGLEPGPSARSIAARRHDIVDEIPADGSFDLVVVHHVLEHLTRPAETLAALAATLRPGGAFWISVPSLDALPETGDFTYVWNDKHVLSLTATAVTSLLARAGVTHLRDSTEESWGSDADREPRDRLMWLGRRTDGPVALPDRPLEPALRALGSYGATRKADTGPLPPPALWRRAARRLRR